MRTIIGSSPKSIATTLALVLCGIVNPAPLISQGVPLDGRIALRTLPTGRAKIVGVVVDSVNGGYLTGAEIVIESGPPGVRTDSLGRFEVDSLRPGIYHVGVLHPLLDSLGITLHTQPVRIAADSTSVMLIAVPSAPTLVGRSCAKVKGQSAIVGHVADPETLEPVAHADVSIAWVEIDVSKEKGIVRKPRLVKTVTDSAGAFRMCGLPNSLEATLQAKRGSSHTDEIPISLGERPVELLARTVLLSTANSDVKSGNATVSGVVALEGDSTRAGSRVELVGSGNAVTNDKGEFVMRNLPSGTRNLVVRRVGFEPEVIPVDLSSREDVRVTMKLRKSVPAMEAVRVIAKKRAVLDEVGFSERRKTGFGYFIGPEKLELMHPNSLTDVLQGVPGLEVIRRQTGDGVKSARTPNSKCVDYYLDGAQYLEVAPGDINKFVSGRDMAAVEVYEGNAPVEYARPGVSCITILLWTRWRVHS
jgi:Carboxypeptidase regulatory-like domain